MEAVDRIKHLVDRRRRRCERLTGAPMRHQMGLISPLDLLGIDGDGRVVIFELKKGVLTREAVAQILDYGSDLADASTERLAGLIEDSSGRNGIPRIDDFVDWYDRTYPDNDEPLAEPPRLVLVGLGVDDRAKRIVNFLAASAIDIQLLTFQGFEVSGQTLLARQIETTPPQQQGAARNKSESKAGNLRVLLESAETLGSKDLLLEVADFIESHMASAYRWPGKTAFTFSLQEQTSEGRPSLRSYATLYLDTKRRSTLLLNLPPRVSDLAEDAITVLCAAIPQARRIEKSWACLEVEITAKSWASLRNPLGALLESVVEAWKRASRAHDERP